MEKLNEKQAKKSFLKSRWFKTFAPALTFATAVTVIVGVIFLNPSEDKLKKVSAEKVVSEVIDNMSTGKIYYEAETEILRDIIKEKYWFDETDKSIKYEKTVNGELDKLGLSLGGKSYYLVFNEIKKTGKFVESDFDFIGTNLKPGIDVLESMGTGNYGKVEEKDNLYVLKIYSDNQTTDEPIYTAYVDKETYIPEKIEHLVSIESDNSPKGVEFIKVETVYSNYTRNFSSKEMGLVLPEGYSEEVQNEQEEYSATGMRLTIKLQDGWKAEQSFDEGYGNELKELKITKEKFELLIETNPLYTGGGVGFLFDGIAYGNVYEDKITIDGNNVVKYTSVINKITDSSGENYQAVKDFYDELPDGDAFGGAVFGTENSNMGFEANLQKYAIIYRVNFNQESELSMTNEFKSRLEEMDKMVESIKFEK